MTVSIAETLNEISAGRYVLGIGAGNTADSDYEAFGFPTDKRYSRFAEAIEIIHTLTRQGTVSFDGDYYQVKESEIVLRGPSPLWINIAGGGPKMLGLAAKYADAWNWWVWGETTTDAVARLQPLIDQLDAACATEDRDPASLERTLDVYTVVAPGFEPDADLDNPIHGSAEDIAAALGTFGDLGIAEVRCDVYPKTPAAIEAMAPVVDLVHKV